MSFKHPDNYNPRIGVEIEFENCCPSSLNVPGFTNYWGVCGDGSLRGENAVELKFLQGFNRLYWKKALTVLDRGFQNIEPYRTPRCSTHVHVDAKQMILHYNTHPDLKNFITMSLLLEPVLFCFVDSVRESSVFCKPSWEAGSALYGKFGLFLSGNTNLSELTSAVSKYSAVNVHALGTHGTIEFRMAPAVGSADELLFWINSVIAVYGAAQEMSGTPNEWLEDFISNYSENVRDIYSWSDYQLNQDELLSCEQRAQVAFKTISYYGGF